MKKEKTDEELMKIHLNDPAEEYIKNMFFKWKNLPKKHPLAPILEKDKKNNMKFKIYPRYLNYWLVINQDGQPLYDKDMRISLFYKKEYAEEWIKNRRKIDKKFKRKRKIINVNLEVI